MSVPEVIDSITSTLRQANAAADATAAIVAERDQLRIENAELRAALEKIAEFCNGYGDVAGLACRYANAALRPDGPDAFALCRMRK